MTATPNPFRVIILANRPKDGVEQALSHFRPWLAERATIVAEPEQLLADREQAQALPHADLALVLGGDGTLLSQARILVDRQIPLLGINFGKVGFLAEFFVDQVKQHWDMIREGACRVSQRMLIEVALFDPGTPEWGGAPGSADADAMPEPVFQSLAMNDAVINAGEPFRMIEIEIAIEPAVSKTSATTFSGDGIVVATPSGSTAYNLAVGGPIVSPGIDGLCIAAIAPQSLAFRPIVFDAHCETWLELTRANPGTTLVLDGQQSVRLQAGQQIRITRHPNSQALIQNPDLNYWKTLAHKMHWAARPRRD